MEILFNIVSLSLSVGRVKWILVENQEDGDRGKLPLPTLSLGV